MIGIRTVRTVRIARIARSAPPLLCLGFIAALAAMPSASFAAALRGVRLWLDIVVPSLLPFFAASELLCGSCLLRTAGVFLEPLMRPLFNIPGSGAFALLMGIVGGYPTGARITAMMRSQGMLTQAEARRLVTFTNNSGPMFIIGAVSVGMLGQPQSGPVLLACHVLACLTVGFIFRFYNPDRGRRRYSGKYAQMNRRPPEINPNKPSPESSCKLSPAPSRDMPFGEAFGAAVRNSIMTLLSIGGFITVFSVLIDILKATGITAVISSAAGVLLTPAGMDSKILEPVVCGLFEITTGTSMAASAPVPPTVKLAACSFIIGWAGFSVHSQVQSMLSGTDIGMGSYLCGKALQGMIASLYTLVYAHVAGMDEKNPPYAGPVFNTTDISLYYGWKTCLVHSLESAALSAGFLILAAALSRLVPAYSRLRSRRM